MQFLLPSIGLFAFILILTAALAAGRRRRSWQHKAEALLGISGILFFALLLWQIHIGSYYLHPLRL